MKYILNYSTTEEFQEHEVETGNTGMVSVLKIVGVVDILPGTSDKGIIWKNVPDNSNFNGDGWYETTGLEYPLLTLGNKYNVNLTPIERLYNYSSYPDTEKFEILEEPHYAAELSGTTYYGVSWPWCLNVYLERVDPTGNHPGEIEVKGINGNKQLYYVQAAETEQRVTSIVPGVAYIRETEEVKYNGIQFPAIDIGNYNTGNYTWEDFGITDEKFGYWKSLMTSGHPLPETFNVFLSGAVPNDVWEYDSSQVIVFGFGGNVKSLKVYSDGRCEIPSGGDVPR